MTDNQKSFQQDHECHALVELVIFGGYDNMIVRVISIGETYRELHFFFDVVQEQGVQVAVLEGLNRSGQIISLHVHGDILVLGEVDA